MHSSEDMRQAPVRRVGDRLTLGQFVDGAPADVLSKRLDIADKIHAHVRTPAASFTDAEADALYLRMTGLHIEDAPAARYVLNAIAQSQRANFLTTLSDPSAGRTNMADTVRVVLSLPGARSEDMIVDPDEEADEIAA